LLVEKGIFTKEELWKMVMVINQEMMLPTRLEPKVNLRE
jgi:hypothetical protein